jgi:hypothetical protein
MKYVIDKIAAQFKTQEEMALFVCHQILTKDRNKDNWYEDLIEDFAFLIVIIKKNNWDNFKEIQMYPENVEQTITTIIDYAEFVERKLTDKNRNDIWSKALDYYNAEMKVTKYYELTDGDITKIQDLINQLRQEINNSPIIENDHKLRILMRLEKMQKELHKRMSDYDKAYGILFDGMVLMQKFGESVKPITELIREISNLFWNSNCRAEQLPSNTKIMLPEPPKEC